MGRSEVEDDDDGGEGLDAREVEEEAEDGVLDLLAKAIIVLNELHERQL